MMKDLFSNHQFLSFIIVSPILIWGIWIVSEESFDGINAVERFNPRKIRGLATLLPDKVFIDLDSWSFTQESMRRRSGLSYRKKYLPYFFIGFTLLVSYIYFAIFIYPELLKPSIMLISVVMGSTLFIKKKESSIEDSLREEFDREIPTLIQLLTVLISSGISPARAIALLAVRSNSISCQRFTEVVNGINSGDSIIESLDQLAQRNQSLVLRRFVTSLILGIERGSSLAPILMSQVKDSRLSVKSETLKRAGKAEIALLIPVVFLILPISILFALWPSYQQLGTFL